MRLMILMFGLVGVLLSAKPAVGFAEAGMHGAGATFPYPIYAWWGLRYSKEGGSKLLYDAIGSGGGIKHITAGDVDFGASDAPLSQRELDKLGLIQFPTVLGGVVPVVNLPGVAKGKLRLTGPVLADLFMGRITRWNNAAITALNPGLSLPDLAVSVVHRSKGSGTTWIFTHYLSDVSASWKQKLGVGKLVDWPVGTAAVGNSGVSDAVAAKPGAIGYSEYANVVESDSNYALLQNQSGNYPEPNPEAFKAAANSANWAGSDDELVLTNKPGAGTWPIAGATFILMYKKQQNPDRAREVLSFIDWGYRKGGSLAELINYVALSDTVYESIEKRWASELRGPNGEVIWQAKGN